MINDHTRHIGVLSVSIYIPAAQSLKDKRMVLRSLRDRVKAKYNASVAELNGQDKWQTAIFGFAVIGNDNRQVDRCLQEILSFIETFRDIEISDYKIQFV